MSQWSLVGEIPKCVLSWRFPNEQSYTELYIYIHIFIYYIYCIYFWGEVRPPKLWGKRENVFHSNRIETIGDPKPRNFFHCLHSKPSQVSWHETQFAGHYACLCCIFLEVRSPICSFSFSVCPTLELILQFLCIYILNVSIPILQIYQGTFLGHLPTF